MSRLADTLLGTDARMRPRTALALLVDGIYGFWALALLVSYRMGLVDLRHFGPIMAIIFLPRLFFYPLCRSGITIRWADAGLTQLQMIHATLVVFLGYAIAPDLRAAFMQCLCLVQVFGLFSLRPRQALTIGLFGVAGMVGLLAVSSVWPLREFDRSVETTRLVMSSFIVTLLALSSTRYAGIRAKVRARKQELAQAVAQVNELITHDALTGLHNRQYMQEALEHERARVLRGGAGFCVVLLDVDHFKDVNDQHGHQVGDEVLVSFARSVQQALRPTDLASRWGGEEFLLLMPEDNPAGHAVAAMQRLQTDLKTVAVCDAIPGLRITFSAGIAGYEPGETMTQLLERADRALYAAKAAGRDRCQLAQSGSPAPSIDAAPKPAAADPQGYTASMR